MRIIDSDSTIIEHLDTPELVDKYQCRFRIKTRAGTLVYFTNITSREDIDRLNFVSLARLKDSDTYVLAPDLKDPRRVSYLIIYQYSRDDHEIIGIKQRIMFDFYTHSVDMSMGQIIALGRDFPETFDSSEYLMSITMRASNTAMRTVTVTEHYGFVKRFVKRSDCSFQTHNFVMFGRYDSFVLGENNVDMLHPITKFVIDDDNIIMTPAGVQKNTIMEFLNLDTVPVGAAIHWVPEGVHISAHLNQMIKFLSNSKQQYLKFVLIGFDYNKAAYIRERLRWLYT